ncbi:phosphoribosyltransferase [Microbacterium oryzae]|uniref:Phosphoribosyltransferase n=1 Tax=Microbacterium oryzae TaxID=743009 RepID=A0A6I6E3Y7_9MICO|nr:phosphoribosyltransferase family protein [Microbacterium oryzae]QGU27150.1 phosphoribosyltransferase [Microbacterium oryzae]
MSRERFRDRRTAGRELAAALRERSWRADLLVLALPRGGVPVAAEVARALSAELDVLVARKLGHPAQPEVAMGAIAGIGDIVEAVENPAIADPRAMGAVRAAEEAELRRRQRTYRGARPPVRIAGRSVLLVDDGLATGATMRAAVAAARREDPAELVVAVPVALGAAARVLRQDADEVVCVWDAPGLWAVGSAYERFDQTGDDEVRALLSEAWEREGPTSS